MTDITELARRVEHIISDMKLKHGDKDTYAPVMKWDEFLALVEALEKAQKRIAELESRTVKLPQRHSMLLREDFNEDYHTEMAYKADEVQASLTASGIKVETE
ncbi:hypothetical protein [Klebsiella quasipneumoniae]|uniref:hypothetical protein n=1 Tax=Klebsiella quasipneumoniae TaxID=1463165 RepID=UPI001F5810B4|nr:hypothetical protein [Klebsiella quasipneumoniae]MCI2966724.1 hypothetical protein [Klebsiella quasipneumoniae]HCB1794307.1 hypothetical protein [Klebsiella quasipneumoniae]